MTAEDDKLEKLEDELAKEREARSRAEAALRAKSDMLAMMAHDVRTSVGALVRLSELLSGTGLDITQRRYVETMSFSSRSLIGVVDGLLDQGQLDSGSLSLRTERFDLAEFVARFSEQVRIQAEIRGLDFLVDLPEEALPFIRGDATRLWQILQNFSSNALKFTAEGEIRFKVEALETTDGHVLCRFEMHDSGPGLSAEEKGRIFEPYQQGGHVAVDGQPGRGLGLHITRQLTELMGGNVGCASVVGQGSVFWLTVHFEIAEKSVGFERDDDVATDLLSGHVLIVDDNAINVQIIGATLREFGVSWDAAKDGAQALSAIQSDSYDAVLMDLRMQGLDGFDVATRIRARELDRPRLPIFALSASAVELDDDPRIVSLFNGLLGKPISANELYHQLSTVLQGVQNKKTVNKL